MAIEELHDDTAAHLDEQLLLRADQALREEAALARRISRQRAHSAAVLRADAIRLRKRLGIESDSLRRRLAQAKLTPTEVAHLTAMRTSLERLETASRRYDGIVRPPGHIAGRPITQGAFILKEDPDLAGALSGSDRRAAEELFRAPVIVLEHTSWEPPALDPSTTYGLLLLDGVLGRRVWVGQAVAIELLSCGDILRPWEQPCKSDFMPPQVAWRVLSRTRVAILDERITRLIGRWPELVVSFSNRLLRRARYEEYVMALSHLRRVEDRVIAALWHLASHCGRVTPRGVRVPVPLTHGMLGEMVGARRPSVTTAMQRLQERGEVVRDADGCYLLPRQPQAELAEI